MWCIEFHGFMKQWTNKIKLIKDFFINPKLSCWQRSPLLSAFKQEYKMTCTYHITTPLNKGQCSKYCFFCHQLANTGTESITCHGRCYSNMRPWWHLCQNIQLSRLPDFFSQTNRQKPTHSSRGGAVGGDRTGLKIQTQRLQLNCNSFNVMRLFKSTD